MESDRIEPVSGQRPQPDADLDGEGEGTLDPELERRLLRIFRRWRDGGQTA
jgi:hypothetical protein